MSTSYTRFNIQDLPSQDTPAGTDLLEVAVATGNDYATKKASIADIGEEIVSGIEWQTELTETTNKTITGAINEVMSAKADITSLATVATSGAYADLSGKPTIDTALDDTSTNAVENRAVAGAIELKENAADMEEDVTDIVVDLTDTQETAEGNPVTLQTVQEGYAKAVLVTFTAKQSGTGDPSPTNIRPLIVYSTLTLNVSDGVLQEDKYIATLPNTAGIGYFDFVRGKLIVTHIIKTYDGSEEDWSQSGTSGDNRRYIISLNVAINDNLGTSRCNYLKEYAGNSGLWGTYRLTSPYLVVKDRDNNFNSLNDFKTYLSTNNLQCLVKLTTPQEITLPPKAIALLKGNNTITTDGDSVKVKYNKLALPDIIGISRYISALEARIEALEGANSNRSLSISPTLTKSLTSELDTAEGKTEETEEETKEEAQKNER